MFWPLNYQLLKITLQWWIVQHKPVCWLLCSLAIASRQTFFKTFYLPIWISPHYINSFVSFIPPETRGKHMILIVYQDLNGSNLPSMATMWIVSCRRYGVIMWIECTLRQCVPAPWMKFTLLYSIWLFHGWNLTSNQCLTVSWKKCSLWLVCDCFMDAIDPAVNVWLFQGCNWPCC